MTSRYLHWEFLPKQEEEFTTKARKDEIMKNFFFRAFVIGFGFFP